MARMARAVIPGYPHHLTQRGVRSMVVFKSDNDRKLYLRYVKAKCEQNDVKILSWCLMDNHTHFIVVPDTEQSIAKAFGEAHRRYTREVNLRENVRGHLF